MDLRQYYRQIREIEARIKDEFPVIVSVATEDGGKPNMLTEVTRAVAARLIAEGKARLAEEGEAAAFRKARKQ